MWGGRVRLGSVMWMCCGFFLPRCGSLGMPFDLILTVLGRFWASCWVSWGLLGRPFGLTWPWLAQDSEKNQFFEFNLRKLAQVGTQVGTPNRKKRCQNRFKIDVKKWYLFKHDFLSIFIGFGPSKTSQNRSFFQFVWKSGFCENHRFTVGKLIFLRVGAS